MQVAIEDNVIEYEFEGVYKLAPRSIGNAAWPFRDE